MIFEFDTSINQENIQKLDEKLRDRIGIDTDQLDALDNPEAFQKHFRTNLEA